MKSRAAESELARISRELSEQRQLFVELHETNLQLHLELQRRQHAQELASVHNYYNKKLQAEREEHERQMKAYIQQVEEEKQQTQGMNFLLDDAEWPANLGIQTPALPQDFSINTGNYDYSSLQSRLIWEEPLEFYQPAPDQETEETVYGSTHQLN